MGIFRKEANPPPDYDAAMSQHNTGPSGAGPQQMSSNPLGPANPPLKPGMAGHSYTEIPPPPATEQAAAQYKGDPREGWQVGPQEWERLQQGDRMGMYGEAQPGSSGGPVMHWYRNAQGHTVQSPLPPSHPAMQCLMQGRHVSDRRFGILGIIIGVLFCPIGCVWTALDYQVTCKRCGEVIDEGCYSC